MRIHHLEYRGVIGLILALISPFALFGCGTCGQVTQNRSEFLAKQDAQPVGRDHHIIVDVPKSLILNQAKESFSSAGTTDVELKKMGDAGRFLDSLTISPRAITLDFDVRNAAKVILDLDVSYGKHKVFGIELDAVAPIEYNAKTKTLTLVIRYDIFRKVTPKISDGAADRLANQLHRQLPSSARSLFSKSRLASYANKGIRHLAAQLYPNIRDSILKPMGEITRFSFKMPDVPIERISLASTPSNLRLGIRTTLSATGVRQKNPYLKKNEIRLAISSDALAKLGNWAMAKGKIPDRYTRGGKPADSGEFVAGLDWQKGRSPMKVNLWTANAETSAMCLFVQAGAVPVVSLKNKKVKVGFKDGRIEEVIGPPFIEEAMDIMGIGERAISYTKAIALKQNLRLGSKRLGIHITGAGITSDALRINMKVDSVSSRSRKKGKSKE